MEIRLRPELRHREEIEEQIREGYASAQRGELLEPEEVRSKLNKVKRARLGDQQRG